MAKLYLAQGKLDKAAQMLEALLLERPDDQMLSQALADTRARRANAGRAMPQDTIALLRVDRGLDCRWFVTPEGQYRGELVLGCAGRLQLRVQGFPRGSCLAPRDYPLSQASGDEILAPPSAARLVVASVGVLADDGRYVSVAHSEILSMIARPPTSDSANAQPPGGDG